MPRLTGYPEKIEKGECIYGAAGKTVVPYKEMSNDNVKPPAKSNAFKEARGRGAAIAGVMYREC
jgi:hypothetical protein